LASVVTFFAAYPFWDVPLITVIFADLLTTELDDAEALGDAEALDTEALDAEALGDAEAEPVVAPAPTPDDAADAVDDEDGEATAAGDPADVDVAEATADESACQGILPSSRKPEVSVHTTRPHTAATSTTTAYGTMRDHNDFGPRCTPTGPAGGLSNSSGV